jgi:hypothetical protein
MTGNDDGDAPFRLLGVLGGFFQDFRHFLDVVGIQDFNEVHSTPCDNSLQRDGLSLAPVRPDSHGRGRLHPGHGRGQVVQNHQDEPRPVVHGVEKTGRTGMVKGRIAYGRYDRLIDFILCEGVVKP